MLLRFGVVQVFAIGATLLAVATTLTIGIGMPEPVRSSTADASSPLCRSAPAQWPPRRPTMRGVLSCASTRDASRSVVLLFCLLGLSTVVLGVVETLATKAGYGRLGDGGAGAGALIAATGAGLLLGAPVAGSTLRRCTARATMRVGACVTGIALVLCAPDGGLGWALGAFALVGIGMQMVLVAGWVLLHRHVQPASTCLVFGLLESQQLVGNAVGAATAGVTIAHFGVWAVVTAAALILAGSMLLLTAPRAHTLTVASTSRVA